MNAFYPWFKLDGLSSFVFLALGLSFILTLIYSAGFMRAKPRRKQYYACVILTALASVAAILANNLIVLLTAWGFLGLLLYLLINMGEGASGAAAKKAFIIVGGSDALMLLGIGIIYSLTGTFQIDKIQIYLDNSFLANAAYLCLAIACFAKAGLMPFHSWIPNCAEQAPLPVTAYLPAALDKLLGIYLLARLSLGIFVMNDAMNILLMLLGAFTIIAAVMMALVQHNMKRMLGYHAVSQVGYMVLGIGTGTLVGIAGGMFHMLNNVIYKSCLFFSAGNVEYRAKTSELDDLGGLARLMPVTYISCVIAGLSISGVPPFNGFVSKWMIYQGLIEKLRFTDYRLQAVAILCLIAAMAGSGFTLASFMKLIHAVFLGERLDSARNKNISEAPRLMWLPCVILASICVLFGVFAFAIPLKYFIFPAISEYQHIDAASFPGTWFPGLATVLIILGLGCGFAAFKFSKLSLRRDSAFVGSETGESREECAVTGVDFYSTIKEMKPLGFIYQKAKDGVFDIYEQSKKLLFISRILRHLHNGVLSTYLVWMLLGMIGLFWALAR